MSEYLKKVDLLSAAVEVEYLGRPRMMVSVAKIGQMSAVEVPEVRKGKWTERKVFRSDDNNTSSPIIDDWQSAKCSVCGKYHTTPYLYYFDDFNYCPHCGARMKGADDE